MNENQNQFSKIGTFCEKCREVVCACSNKVEKNSSEIVVPAIFSNDLSSVLGKCTCLRPQPNCFSGSCAYCNRIIVSELKSKDLARTYIGTQTPIERLRNKLTPFINLAEILHRDKDFDVDGLIKACNLYKEDIRAHLSDCENFYSENNIEQQNESKADLRVGFISSFKDKQGRDIKEGDVIKEVVIVVKEKSSYREVYDFLGNAESFKVVDSKEEIEGWFLRVIKWQKDCLVAETIADSKNVFADSFYYLNDCFMGINKSTNVQVVGNIHDGWLLEKYLNEQL